MVEWEADWLPGYEDSKPVRIGNGAAGQFQLDVFGEVASALARMPEAEDDIRVSAGDVQMPRWRTICAMCGSSRTKGYGRCAAGRSSLSTRR